MATNETLRLAIQTFASRHLQEVMTEGAGFFNRDDGPVVYDFISGLMRGLVDQAYDWPDGDKTIICDFRLDDATPASEKKIQIQMHQGKNVLEYKGISVITSGGIRGGDGKPEFYPPRKK